MISHCCVCANCLLKASRVELSLLLCHALTPRERRCHTGGGYKQRKQILFMDNLMNSETMATLCNVSNSNGVLLLTMKIKTCVQHTRVSMLQLI